MFHTVYKTTNILNGRYYIGVHSTEIPNDSYLGSGIAIKQAIKKYGAASFIKEVLFIFDHRDDAYAKERELVSLTLVEDDKSYNIQIGGTPSVQWCDERRLMAKHRLSGAAHPMYGKHHTSESNDKRSRALKKWNQTEEGKRCQIQIHLQLANKRRGQPSPLRGSKQSLESNQKRSVAHKQLVKVECPHCRTFVDPGNAKRWHFNRCKRAY